MERPVCSVLIAPAFGWHACITPLHFTKAKIRFCDVSLDSFNMDLNQVKTHLNERTKVALALHLYGVPLDVDQLKGLNKDMKIIEDCSHAIGVNFKGKKLGTFGDVGCMSLQQGKLICGGEAGALITNDSQIVKKVIQLALPGRKFQEENFHDGATLGLKFRPHPLALHLALSQFKKRDELNIELKKGFELVRTELESFDKRITFQTATSERSYYHCRFYIKGLTPAQKKSLVEKVSKKTDIINSEDYFFLPQLSFLNSFVGEYPNAKFLSENLLWIHLPKILNAENESLLRKSLDILKNELSTF